MSIETAPAFRLETTRTHLHRDRDYQPAQSRAELFVDALLDGLSAAVPLGSRKQTLTAAELADAVEAAEKNSAAGTDPAVCPGCAHRWSDHVGRAGCMECDGCRERRPQASGVKAGGQR